MNGNSKINNTQETAEKITKRKALVTGGTKGIGLEIVATLAAANVDVIFCSRSAEFQHDSDLKKTGELQHIQCDVTDETNVAKLIQHIKDKWDHLDILVNNCGGIANTGTCNDLSKQHWQQALDINLLSAVDVTQKCYPLLLKSDCARVVNISSLTAIQPGTHNPHYAAAKAALNVYSKNLSQMWATDNILVNTLSPGIIETPAWQDYLQNKAQQENVDLSTISDQEYQRAVASVPLQKMGAPKDVANAVKFLTSVENQFITGANLVIDGGKFRGI